jgi:hypothetical protein|tara:strand:+ start:23760 stop:24026 length:267 start_codon:yes stop_codon:yes gene_type:complete
MLLSMMILSLMPGCAILPELALGGVNAASAFWSYRAASAEKVQVLTKDCEFTKAIYLTEKSISGIALEDKRKIVLHNKSVAAVCGETE